MNVFTGEMSAEQTRMNELYTTLKAWSDAYYNDDAPLATDEEYDRLMRELKQLEAEHPYWVAEDSPTQNVGGKRVMGIPVEHRVPICGHILLLLQSITLTPPIGPHGIIHSSL